MARFARIALPRRPYLIAHVGHRGENVFYSSKDRRGYLALLAANAEKFKMEVWAYSLLPNQVNLLVYPRTAGAMAEAVGRTHVTHARRVNGANGWTGPFWAGRFHSTLLDTPHLWEAVRYVECLPVLRGLARRPEKFPWSSARAHALGKAAPLLSPNSSFPDPKRVGDWAAWLNEGPGEAMEETLRKNVSTGRPSVSPAILKRLEKSLGLALVPRKRGPKPRK